VNIQSLIIEACQKDKDFDSRIKYRLGKRRKQPDLDWLMMHLENILGRDYVQENAKKQIEKANEQ
jgi:hypothetical protein